MLVFIKLGSIKTLTKGSTEKTEIISIVPAMNENKIKEFSFLFSFAESNWQAWVIELIKVFFSMIFKMDLFLSFILNLI